MNKEPTAFFEKMLPAAQTASKDLNIPVSVILAQWAIESAYGTSDLAQRSGNYAGITHVTSSIDYGATGRYADYKGNIDMFVQDYTRVLNLSRYKAVRDAVSVEDTIKALSNSSYAASGYNGGKSLLDVIKQYDLQKYDTGTKTINIPVDVPLGASNGIIALAVIAAGLAMLKAIVK